MVFCNLFSLFFFLSPPSNVYTYKGTIHQHARSLANCTLEIERRSPNEPPGIAYHTHCCNNGHAHRLPDVQIHCQQKYDIIQRNFRGKWKVLLCLIQRMSSYRHINFAFFSLCWDVFSSFQRHNVATKKKEKKPRASTQCKVAVFFPLFLNGIVKPHPHVGETTFPYSIPGKRRKNNLNE